ncbi:MAG: hypothetical protein HC778_04595 [Chamaesiphon sp. CSU_1_12]|nr:hypothetical protein [Chamaesiphon sp. CSU_1_12]
MTYTLPQSQSALTERPKFTDAEYRDKCLSITGTRCLHRLKSWCDDHQICQTKWSDLARNIITRIVDPHDRSYKQQNTCCIQQEINERAQLAQKSARHSN